MLQALVVELLQGFNLRSMMKLDETGGLHIIAPVALNDSDGSTCQMQQSDLNKVAASFPHRTLSGA